MLVGEVDVDCEINTDFLKDMFEEYFYYEKVYDDRTTSVPRARSFEPTVDELATLKHLELGQSMEHARGAQAAPVRAAGGAATSKTAQGQFILTDSGRRWIRRQEGLSTQG